MTDENSLARVWQEGYTAGHSNAMRRMSDEPNAPTSENPYERTLPRDTPWTCGNSPEFFSELVCAEPFGHDGDHKDEEYSWEDE